jgi:molybdopterin/thiamine biosynthesis adenylyltransferase
VFKYADTASSRAGIGALNDRVAGQRIGIAGIGGTGSYILDLVTKTHVSEIHLFDKDVFLSHNAFRAPGAPTAEHLESRPRKIAHFSRIYSNMRNGIVMHDVFLEEANLSLLSGLDFVFLCLDAGDAKRLVVDKLVASATPFIETGMGVILSDGRLRGIVRTSTSTPGTRAKAAPYISFSARDGVVNEYETNIQTAELNALNAALAVIRWKQYMGIYQDTREQYYSGYSIASGEIVGEGEK